jgi:hypothetical protein
MAWLLEATSSKFVIAGAVLLVHGRVDGHPAILAIAPAAASSAISTRLAKEIDPTSGHPRPFRIHIRRELVTSGIAAHEPTPSEGADVRLGMDFLRANPVVIDFASHSLHLIDSQQMQSVPKHYIRLSLGSDAGGKFLIGVARKSTSLRAVRLDFSQSQSSGPPVQGCIASIRAGIATSPEAAVGLGLFAGQTVIFDLANYLVWIRKGPAAQPLLCQ